MPQNCHNKLVLAWLKLSQACFSRNPWMKELSTALLARSCIWRTVITHCHTAVLLTSSRVTCVGRFEVTKVFALKGVFASSPPSYIYCLLTKVNAHRKSLLSCRMYEQLRRHCLLPSPKANSNPSANIYTIMDLKTNQKFLSFK